jgi:hypothetical protein
MTKTFPTNPPVNAMTKTFPTNPPVDVQRRAAEARSETFAAALEVHLVERKKLEDELAASRAATKTAERETRSLRRKLATAEGRESNARSIFTETAEDLRARAARRPVADFDAIFSMLQGSPDAQALARMVVDAARRARGEHDGKEE